MTVDIVSLAQRPELMERCWALTERWPPFILEDPIADLYFSRLGEYGQHALVAVENDEVVARAFAVPFAMGADVRRPELPAAGWDGVIRWAWLDELAGRAATHLSALEITVTPDHRGTGLAERLLAALKQSARDRDLPTLVAPVRPSRKHEQPHTPMEVYAARTRQDGLPVDPWLRLHVRAGGHIHGVCPHSMTVPGSLNDWRSWTGLTLETSGDIEIPGALAPVHVSIEQDHAVYVEPNVWIVHDLDEHA